MKKFVGIIALFCMLIVNPVFAAEDNMSDKKETKWFVGGGYLKSDADTGIGSLTGTASLDEEDNGFKIFAGYQLNPYVGFEIAYADLGTVSLTGNTGDTFVLDGTSYSFLADDVTLDVETWTIDLGATFSLPLDKATGKEYMKYLTPFAKIGGFYWDQDASATGSGLNRTTTSEDGFDIYFGGGLSINIHKNFAITGEWLRYNGDDDIDTYGVNLVIKF